MKNPRRLLGIISALLLIAMCSLYLIWDWRSSRPAISPSRAYVIDHQSKAVVLDGLTREQSAEKIGDWLWETMNSQQPLRDPVHLHLPDFYYVVLLMSDNSGEVYELNLSHSVIVRMRDRRQFKFNIHEYLRIMKQP